MKSMGQKVTGNKSVSDSSLDAVLDVFEAVKRALIREGRFRQVEGNSQAPSEPSVQKKLNDAAVKSHDVLLRANTVFPLTLFPDTVSLDREKLTIVTRYFIRTSQAITIPIPDIVNVEVTTGPFFGAVHITVRDVPSGPYTVKNLSRNDALMMQRLLEGYIIAHEQKINCEKIDKSELIVLLQDLGKGDTD